MEGVCDSITSGLVKPTLFEATDTGELNWGTASCRSKAVMASSKSFEVKSIGLPIMTIKDEKIESKKKCIVARLSLI